MKYVILRCEDQAPYSEQTATLLAGAKTPHLQQLAQAGAMGAIRFRNDPPAGRLALTLRGGACCNEVS